MRLLQSAAAFAGQPTCATPGCTATKRLVPLMPLQGASLYAVQVAAPSRTCFTPWQPPHHTAVCMSALLCVTQEGCGSPNSCSAYMASLSPMSYANGIQGLVPAAGWGRFGSGCLPDGRWPYRTCSLKQVADTVNPPAWGQGSGSEGWISGVTPKPSSNISGCINGFTDLTCKTCIATRNPMLCFSCMQGSTSWRGGPPQCAACANGGRCQTL